MNKTRQVRLVTAGVQCKMGLIRNVTLTHVNIVYQNKMYFT